MADTKISALPASTTPLAGTEVLPIVQGGATRQVSVANLTAGRALSATQLTLTTGNLIVASGQGIDFSATPGTGTSELLADYEEGTWTPVVSDGTTDVSMAAGAGWYVKVGKVVTVGWNSYYLDISTLGALAQVRIQSLPFTAAAKDTWSAANFPFDNVGKNYCQRIPASGTNLFFFVTQASAGDFAECTRTTLGGTAVSFFGSMTYFSA